MQLAMTKLSIVRTAAVLAAILAMGCGPEGDGMSTLDEESGPQLGIQLAAVQASCSQGGIGTQPQLADIRVSVTGPDEKTGFIKELVGASKQIPTSGASLEIPNVPASDTRLLVVTARGTLRDANSTPVFSRSPPVTVPANKVVPLDMLLVPCGQYGCAEVAPSFGNILFPAVTSLPDGRVIIAGGFQAASSYQAQDGVQEFRIEGPSDKVFVFGGGTGVFHQVPEVMKRARGASGAMYVPSKRQVIIFGGAQQLIYAPGRQKFAFRSTDLASDQAANAYEVLSLDALDRRLSGQTGAEDPIFLPPPNQMLRPRIFPRAVRLERDDAILITGGGTWPRSGPNYLEAEYYHRRAFDESGGFVDPRGSLVLNTLRAGHTMTRIGLTQDGFARALIWGGTTDAGFVGEVFKEGSSQGAQVNGVFTPVEVTAGVLPPYFHAAAAVSDTRVLVVGGVEPNGTENLVVPVSPRAYLLDYVEQGGRAVVSVIEVGGLDGPRIFPALGVTRDRTMAILTGGWSNDGAGVSTATLTLNLSTEPPTFQPEQALFSGRGGMSSRMLKNDALFLAGGVADPAQINATGVGAAETFAPAAYCY
jgi:hypothetical protein